MKLLLVSLALSIFTGSQAFVLRDESQSQKDQFERELDKCFKHLYETVNGKWQMFSESEIGAALTDWIPGRVEDTEERLRALGTAFPPEVLEVREQISSAHQQIVGKLWDETTTLQKNIAPQTEALEQALESDLNQALEKLEPYLQPLHQSLQACTGLNEKLTEMLKPVLEKLQPRAEKVQEQVREAGDVLDPIVGQVQKYLVSEVEGAREVLQRSAAHVLEVFNKYREGFKQWIQTPLIPERQ